MKSISPKELNNIIESGNSECQLIDIRDEYEHDICCIGGEKINMYSIPENIDLLSKNKKIIIYCRTGVRSANSCHLMKELGFTKTYNLIGGIVDWNGEIID